MVGRISSVDDRSPRGICSTRCLVSSCYFLSLKVSEENTLSKTYISVCKNVILSNLKNGTDKPPMRMSRGKHGKPMHFKHIEFEGKGRIVYSPTKPLPWGARVWIELD